MSAFPFDAVVGHDDAKLALRLAALDPLIGGVLLRGHKGTAKTTLARALAGLLGDAPFVELPLGATEDRLVGSLDVAAALGGGEVTFHPGLLAAAHGGVLYVDEVNLLADHLVDVLLDVAASGRNVVERDGISHQHPARFVLIGSMNPEEGELRPQLLDRFGMCVTVETSTDLTERTEAVRRRLAFDRGETDLNNMTPSEPAPTGHRSAIIDDDLIDSASRLALAAGVEGLRADLALCRAAAALAGLEGAGTATRGHLERVAPLVLAHRCRRGPFDPPVMPPETLSQLLEEPRHPDSGLATDRPLPVGAPLLPQDSPRPRPVPSTRGRVVGDSPARAGDSIAIVPTARHLAQRGEEAHDVLRSAERVERPRRTTVLCMDLSGSIGADERAKVASGTVVGLLTQAYERRESIALVTFSGAGAQVVLTPTASIEVARHRLGELHTGGATPLAEGLLAASEVARRVEARGGSVRIALLSDGHATGSPDAFDRAIAAAGAIRQAAIDALMLDCSTARSPIDLAGQVADALGAPHVRLAELTATSVTEALQQPTSARR